MDLLTYCTLRSLMILIHTFARPTSTMAHAILLYSTASRFRESRVFVSGRTPKLFSGNLKQWRTDYRSQAASRRKQRHLLSSCPRLDTDTKLFSPSLFVGTRCPLPSYWAVVTTPYELVTWLPLVHGWTKQRREAHTEDVEVISQQGIYTFGIHDATATRGQTHR